MNTASSPPAEKSPSGFSFLAESCRPSEGEIECSLHKRLTTAEAELEEANREQQRLAAAIRQLEELANLARGQAEEELGRLLRLQAEFVGNMRHELRTPLHGILGMAALGLRATDLEKSRHACRRILQAGRQLSTLVENVLDFSRVDAGEYLIQASSTSLHRTLESVARRILPQATAKGLAFDHRQESNLPRHCRTDRKRLVQILDHLLDNALKFTQQGSIVLTSARDGAWLVFTVADTGVGLSADQLQRLFVPFEQGDGSLSRRFGGMGLGLALCAHLARQMGGLITADPSPSHGSRFVVRLPYIAT